MAIGGWNGAAEGFQRGMALGTDAADSRAKRAYLMQQQVQAQVERVSAAVDSQLKVMEAVVGQAAQRNPSLDSSIQAQTKQLTDTISSLKSLGTPEAVQASDILLQRVNTVVPNLHTMSEKLTLEQQGKEKSAEELTTAKFGPAAGAAPVAAPSLAAPAGAPAIPGGLAAPPPPPMGGAAPEQTALPWLQQQPAPEAAPAPMPTAAPSPMMAQAQAEPTPPVGMEPPAAAPEPPAAPQSFLKTLVNPATGNVDLQNIPPQDIEAVLANPNYMLNINGQKVPLKDAFQQAYGVDVSEAIAGPAKPGSDVDPRTAYKNRLMGIELTDEEKEQRKMDIKDHSAAVKTHGDALQILRTVAHQRDLLHKGIFSGMGADLKLGWARGMNALGGEKDPRVANTQEFMRAAAENAAKIIKNFGAGTGLSDADREFAYRLAAGDTSMDEDSLRMALDAITKKALWVLASPAQAVPADPKSIIADAARLGVELPEGF